MNQMGAFQVKSVALQVAEHFLHPHPAVVCAQCLSPGGEVSRQQPGLFFALLPMGQQVARVRVFAGQQPLAQPQALTGPLDRIPEMLPVASRKPDQMVRLLPQDILPSPGFHLPDDLYSTKLTVSYQQNGDARGNQPLHIGQQGQLLDRRTVSTAGLDPGPGNGNCPAAKGQADHQQLMSKTDFGAVSDQPDFPHRLRGGLEELLGNRLKPFPDANGWVIQKTAQTAGDACHRGRAWDL